LDPETYEHFQSVEGYHKTNSKLLMERSYLWQIALVGVLE